MKTLSFEKILLIFSIITGIFATGNIIGQEKISLEQAINAANENHPLLKSRELSVEIANKNLDADKVSLYPNVHGSFSVQHNLIIPSTPVPVGKLQGNINSDELALIKFGTKWQAGLGLNLSYDIINPARKQQLIESSTAQRNASLDLDATKSTITLGVISAYSNLVLAGEQLKFASEDTLVSQTEWKVAQSLFNKNRLTKADLNSSEKTYIQAISRYRQAKSIFEQAQIELSYQMGNTSEETAMYNPSDSLPTLLSKLTDELPSTLSLLQSVGYRKIASQTFHDSLTLLNTKRNYLPTVSLVASYGSSFYEQTPVIFNTKDWYGNSLVGLQISIPLTQNFTTGHHVSSARLKMQQNELDRQDYENRHEADLKKVLADIAYSEIDLQLKQSAIKLSYENMNLSRDLLAQGRILPADFLAQQLDYQNTQVDYLQTAYNLINSKIQLKQLLENE